jgi:hypothetical protein
MFQHSGFQVRPPTIRSYEFSGFNVNRHGVYGKVASRQVLFNGYTWVGIKLKSVL